MQGLTLVLFAITAGFTASGIVSNLYRLLGCDSQGRGGQTLRTAVLIVAGPSVLFELAVRSRLTKEWPPFAFWLVVSIVAYWCLVLGLLVLEFAAAL